jgi:hypothetical protein
MAIFAVVRTYRWVGNCPSTSCGAFPTPPSIRRFSAPRSSGFLGLTARRYDALGEVRSSPVPASSEGRARRPPRVCRAQWHLILDPLISAGAARFAPGRGRLRMTRLFTVPASPSWRARELDWPPRRCSAPFGWEHHPVTLVLAHAPTRTAQLALPAASRVAAPACDWHRASRPAPGRL